MQINADNAAFAQAMPEAAAFGWKVCRRDGAMTDGDFVYYELERDGLIAWAFAVTGTCMWSLKKRNKPNFDAPIANGFAGSIPDAIHSANISFALALVDQPYRYADFLPPADTE